MTPDRLAEIEGCERDTRDGPWTLADANDGDGTPPLWVVSTPEDADDDWSVAIHVGDKGVGEFIAMARTAVPELLAEYARLTAQAARLDAEWSAGHPYDNGRPGLCIHGNQGEHNARQMASHGDGWKVLRRLVGPWREVSATPACAPTPNGIICACGKGVGHQQDHNHDTKG